MTKHRDSTCQPPRKMGRPTIFTDHLAERICALVAEGLSTKRICEREDMPDRDTVRVWLHDKPDFSGMYARAREVRAEQLAEEVLEIADSEDDPQRARLRMDARRWLAAKFYPRMFGDQSRVNVNGDLKVTNEDGPNRVLRESERDARILELLAKLGTRRAAEPAGGQETGEGEDEFPLIRAIDRRAGGSGHG